MQVLRQDAARHSTTISDIVITASSRSNVIYLLDASSSGCALPCGFCGQLLTRCLATSGLTGSLLCTCHCWCKKFEEQKATKASEAVESVFYCQQRCRFEGAVEEALRGCSKVFDRAALTVAPASQHWLHKPAKLHCQTQPSQNIESFPASCFFTQSWHPRQQQQRRNQHPPRRQSPRNPPVVARRALRRLSRATRSTSTRYIIQQHCGIRCCTELVCRF